MATAVSVNATGNADIDGVLAGVRWSGPVTYSFPDSPTDYASGYGYGEPHSNFSQIAAGTQAAVDAVMASLEALTNITINYAGTNGADVMLAKSSAANPTSYAYYPGNYAEGGDVWFGTAYDYSHPHPGDYYYATVVHEIGHAFGLKHGQERGGPANVALPSQHDDLEYSVMTYRSYIGGSTTGGYTNEDNGYPQTYMMSDIAALQAMYGANFNTNSGDTTYSWDPATGEMSVDGTVTLTPGGNRVFETIWDGGGNDTYDFSAYPGGVAVDLRPGSSSITSRAQLAYLGNGHYAQGNVYNAYLYQGDAHSYIENAIGGAGNDTLTGNDVANTLQGGDGNDNLDGGAGADDLIGGAGNDTYTVDNAGDVADETGGAGTDLVQALVTFSLADATHAKGAIENLTLMGSASIDGTGNGFDNIITGNAAANTLMGMGGNDTLDGGNGADHMLGGAGDDTYVVDNAGDVADETGGDGTDLVQSSITFSLADGAHVIGAVESLTLTGSAAIDGTGNNLNNVITGNAAANVLTGLDGDDTLDGGKGADRLFGGLGNDSYIVDNKKDVADETGGDGTDTVFSAVAFSLSNANQALGAIENLTLTGSGGIKGTGNALDNIIAGNSGKNTLAGQGGADTFVFTSGFGKDTIKDFGAGSAAGHDFVQFSTSVFADFAAVLSHAADTKHDVVITFDANDTLTLHSVHKADLVSGDFLFV